MDAPDPVTEFLNANADLPREKNGIRMRFAEAGIDILLFVQVPSDVSSRDIHNAVPLIHKWQQRIYALQDRFEDDAMRNWCDMLDSGAITIGELAAYICKKLTEAVREYAADQTNARPFNLALSILHSWGYNGEDAKYILGIALNRISQGKQPFRRRPVPAIRVRNKVNQWKKSRAKPPKPV